MPVDVYKRQILGLKRAKETVVGCFWEEGLSLLSHFCSFSCMDAMKMCIRDRASADVPLRQITRYDLNIASGIIHTAKEYAATDVIIGLHLSLIHI